MRRTESADRTMSGLFEQAVLVATSHGDPSLSVDEVGTRVGELLGRSVARGAVYTALARLQQRRLVGSHTRRTQPRPLRVYQVTVTGRRTLARTHSVVQRVWETLQAMPGAHANPPRRPHGLYRSAPYFPVADVAASAQHYQRVLGFTIEYQAGQPPEFAICARDGLAVMLRRVASADRITPVEAQGGSWDAFFWVADAEALARELTTSGAAFVYKPTHQPAYHMLEFAVRDSDGHVLGFGESVAPSTASARGGRKQ